MSVVPDEFPRKPLAGRPALISLMGPGLVWMALAQGSGELIWWPYIIAKYGLGFLFLLIPACLLQFPLTFEIGRYTVLTGEGVFRGFFRLGKLFGWLLWVLFTLSFLWFGAFASAGGTAIAKLTDLPRGWSHEAQTLFWGQSSIVMFTFAIVCARSVYRLVEWVMKVVAVVSLMGMVVACAHPRVRSVWGEFLTGIVAPDWAQVERFAAADAKQLLTAITFAGLGGFWTLFYSYWLKEKGIGMAADAEPITGLRSAVAPIRRTSGALPTDQPQAPVRLRSWYRYLSLETLIGIVGNLTTTLLACLLAFALLHPEGKLPQGFDIAVVQSEFFAVSWGDVGRLLFLFIAGAFLADTWLATVDAVARIQLDALGSVWPKFAERDQRSWYYGLVIGLALITSVTMFFDQPGPLIMLSALIGFVGTVLYSAALIVLNHRLVQRQLPISLRCGRTSLIAMTMVTVCYLGLMGGFLYIQLPIWLGG